MNVLKLSLIRKKLKTLCSHLKHHPETINTKICDGCGEIGYHNRCVICKTKVCEKCLKRLESGIFCSRCLEDGLEKVEKINEIENQIVPLRKRLTKLERTRQVVSNQQSELRRKQWEITKLWSKQKIWDELGASK